MKGAKGESGESIAVPTVAVSPANMTVNDSKTAFFQCSVSDNLCEHGVNWKGSHRKFYQQPRMGS